MSIIFYQATFANEPGTFPRRPKLVSTDSFSTITAAGYLNSLSRLEADPIKPTDIIDCIYSYNVNTLTGTYAQFIPVISNGVITLVVSNISGTVTVGDVPLFNNINGQLIDSGAAPSAPANAFFVMSNGSLGVNNVAIFKDANGTLQDSGIPVTSIQNYQTSVTTLTISDIEQAYATPNLLIPAPGAGKAIIITSALTYLNFFANAYASGGAAVIQYGNTVHGGGTLAVDADTPSTVVTASSSQIYVQYGPVTTTALTGITNQGIYWSNKTTGFTTGTSTITIQLQYAVMTATV